MASQAPTMYDGITNPVTFAEYFRLQAIYQDWDNDKCCAVIPLFLRGKAKKVLEAFNPKNVIEDILKEIIAKCEQPKEFLFNEFLQRKPLSGESMAQYAAALEILLQAADPAMPPASQTKLLKSQLTNSLPEHTRELINFNPTMTWPDLISNLDRSSHRVAQSEIKLPLIKIEPIETELNWLSSQGGQNRPQYPGSNQKINQSTNQVNRFNGTCNYCNKIGHKEFECRSKARDNSCNSTTYDYNRDFNNNNNNSYNRASNYRTSNANRAYNSNNYSSNNRTNNINTTSRDGINRQRRQETEPPISNTISATDAANKGSTEFPFLEELNLNTVLATSKTLQRTELLYAVVQLRLFNQPQTQLNALIDGGSTHSFISPTALSATQLQMAADKSNKLSERHNFVITSATSSAKSACCVITAQLKVGEWVGNHSFIISGAVTKHEIIIGRDFFKQHNVEVNHGDDSMTVNGVYIKLNVEKQPPIITATLLVGNQIKMITSESSDIGIRSEDDQFELTPVIDIAIRPNPTVIITKTKEELQPGL